MSNSLKTLNLSTVHEGTSMAVETLLPELEFSLISNFASRGCDADWVTQTRSKFVKIKHNRFKKP